MGSNRPGRSLSLLLGVAGLWGVSQGNDTISVAVIVHLSVAPLYYLYALCFFYLSDMYFNRRRYILFLVLATVLILCSSLLITGITMHYDKGSFAFGFTGNLIGVILVAGAASILRYSKQKINRTVELQQYKAAHAEAEMKLLKQQLNPHFLFNTLNSIYLRCMDNSAGAGEMILQLSDMLRYQLDTGLKDRVRLQEELDFIDNYIYFEQNRLVRSMQVQYHKQIDEPQIQIAPHLIITLIENTFKHASRSGEGDFIDIRLQLVQSVLTLETRNNCLPAKGTSPGIGLQNLRQRLMFLYEGRHVLRTFVQQNTFIAQLEIRL
jgi:sensor histidine kinase YesM